MKKQFIFDKLPLIVTFFCVIIFIIVLIWDNTIVRHEIQQAALEDVGKIEATLINNFSGELDEQQDDLSLIADYIAKQNVTSENITEFFNNQSQIQEFDDLYYITLDGTATNTDGAIHNFSENPLFKSILNNHEAVFRPLHSPAANELFIEFAVPVISNGRLTAILLSRNSTLDFKNDMISALSNLGDAYIIDENQMVLLSTNGKYASLDNFIESDQTIINDEAVAILKQNIAKEESGNFRYYIDNTAKIALYSPIEQTSWTMILTFEESKINNDLEVAINSIVQISVGVVVVLIFSMIYTWYTRSSLLKVAEKNAYEDPLTGLPNLLKLKKDMEYILTKNPDKKYAIIKFDIENFNAINEMFSVEIGNRVLKAFKTIRETVDEPSLIIARVSADEFMLFSGNGFIESMQERTHIYEACYNNIIPELGDFRINFKYGRYHIELGENDVDSIINKVSMAHKMSKGKKSNTIHDFDSVFKNKLIKTAEIVNEMRGALENKEFKIYLQPKFQTSTKKIIGAEALVRWIKPNGSIVYPDIFIPLFEKTGFIIELDKYMLNRACEVISSREKRGLGYLPISVNFSRINLSNKNFIADISKIVDSYNIPHELIEVELTESIMVEDQEILENLFTQLHKSGFSVSIDDFGSGFSSLSLLKNFKADTLKIDKAFFNNNKDIIRGNVIIDGVIKLAQSLRMFVVAEGVETAEQFKLLKEIGCDAVQGYYFEKPIPLSLFDSKYSDVVPLSSAKDNTPITTAVSKSNNQNFDIALNILNQISIASTLFNQSFSQLSCNQATLDLFEITNIKQWNKMFFELSPKTQPDGADSRIQALEYIDIAKQNGIVKFDWTHSSINGEPIDCEVTISRIRLLDNNGEELFVGQIIKKK